MLWARRWPAAPPGQPGARALAAVARSWVLGVVARHHGRGQRGGEPLRQPGDRRGMGRPRRSHGQNALVVAPGSSSGSASLVVFAPFAIVGVRLLARRPEAGPPHGLVPDPAARRPGRGQHAPTRPPRWCGAGAPASSSGRMLGVALLAVAIGVVRVARASRSGAPRSRCGPRAARSRSPPLLRAALTLAARRPRRRRPACWPRAPCSGAGCSCSPSCWPAPTCSACRSATSGSCADRRRARRCRRRRLPLRHKIGSVLAARSCRSSWASPPCGRRPAGVFYTVGWRVARP